MRNLATLMAVAALATVVMALNVAKAGEVTILVCTLDSAVVEVKACDTTETAFACGADIFEVDDSCATALDDLFTNRGYGGRKSNFASVGDGTDIIYTLVRGDD